MFPRHWQPGFAKTETSVGQPGRPWHRRSTAITAFEIGPEFDAKWILQILKGDFRLGQAEFLSLIDAGPSPERQKSRQEHLGQSPLFPVRFQTLTGSSDHPQVVMVAHRPSSPSPEEDRLRLSDHLAERSDSEGSLHQLKIVTTVKVFSSPRVLGADADHLHVGHLADQISIIVLVNQSPKFSQQLQSPLLVPGMDQLL